MQPSFYTSGSAPVPFPLGVVPSALAEALLQAGLRGLSDVF